VNEAVLVDTNVLVDVINPDSAWLDWSSRAISELGRARLAINPIIYAELSVHFEQKEELDATVSPLRFARLDLPWEAAFVAGKAFLAYRRAGGARRSALPDFFIGAHAAVAGMRLLTRDPTRYRTYFPKLELIAP
jgi:predicted nucleic acid-binding protein